MDGNLLHNSQATMRFNVNIKQVFSAFHCLLEYWSLLIAVIQLCLKESKHKNSYDSLYQVKYI